MSNQDYPKANYYPIPVYNKPLGNVTDITFTIPTYANAANIYSSVASKTMHTAGKYQVTVYNPATTTGLTCQLYNIEPNIGGLYAKTLISSYYVPTASPITATARYPQVNAAISGWGATCSTGYTVYVNPGNGFLNGKSYSSTATTTLTVNQNMHEYYLCVPYSIAADNAVATVAMYKTAPALSLPLAQMFMNASTVTSIDTSVKKTMSLIPAYTLPGDVSGLYAGGCNIQLEVSPVATWGDASDVTVRLKSLY